MNIFVDIDGTLTLNGKGPWGALRDAAIERTIQAIAEGHNVIIWSAQGEEYAREFCEVWGLDPYLCIAKPDMIVDDHLDIRPGDKMQRVSPEDWKIADEG